MLVLGVVVYLRDLRVLGWNSTFYYLNFICLINFPNYQFISLAVYFAKKNLKKLKRKLIKTYRVNKKTQEFSYRTKIAITPSILKQSGSNFT